MKKIRVILSLTLCLIIMVSLVPNVMALSGGTCGENLKWVLDDEGVLTINGNGPMLDYDLEKAPWSDSRDNIKKIIIRKGVTTVGKSAFNECKNVTNIEIPHTLVEIGDRAFSSTSITDIKIPENVKKIGEMAFLVCTSLRTVTIADGVEEIDDFAFEYCSSLTTVKLPRSIKKMGMCVFRMCDSMKDVYYSGSEEDWSKAKVEQNWAHLAGQHTFHYNSRNSDIRLVLKIGEKTALVNEKPMENDVSPIISNGRTMLPVRFLAENLGIDVSWDGTTGTVTIIESTNDKMKKVKRTLMITVGSNEAFVDNRIVTMDTPAFIKDGRTYLPVRFIGENLGCYIEWLPETQQVIIDKFID